MMRVFDEPAYRKRMPRFGWSRVAFTQERPIPSMAPWKIPRLKRCSASALKFTCPMAKSLAQPLPRTSSPARKERSSSRQPARTLTDGPRILKWEVVNMDNQKHVVNTIVKATRVITTARPARMMDCQGLTDFLFVQSGVHQQYPTRPSDQPACLKSNRPSRRRWLRRIVAGNGYHAARRWPRHSVRAVYWVAR